MLSLDLPFHRCMTMDENVYSNPQAFYPERYLPKPEGNGEPFPGSIFGFGRRFVVVHVAGGFVQS